MPTFSSRSQPSFETRVCIFIHTAVLAEVALSASLPSVIGSRPYYPPCLGSDRQQKCVSFDRDSNKPSHSICIRAVSLKFLLLSKCHSIKVPKVAQKGQIQPDRRMLQWPQEQGLCYWLKVGRRKSRPEGISLHFRLFYFRLTTLIYIWYIKYTKLTHLPRQKYMTVVLCQKSNNCSLRCIPCSLVVSFNQRK